MADFCTHCYNEMFPPGEPDIDVNKIFEGLKEDMMSYGHLCEGCGLTAIGRINGKLQVAYCQDLVEDTEIPWKDYTNRFNEGT